MNFHHFAKKVSQGAGSIYAFMGAFILIIGWLLLGPAFDFSATWQLWINTLTTIITFLMVFVIQHAQNADTKAMHLKLDELIRAISEAHNELIAIEEKD